MVSSLLTFLLLLSVPPVPGSAGIALPDRSEDRQSLSPEERLEERLAALHEATETEQALQIADEVLSIWRQQGGATATLLMDRGLAAESADDLDTAATQYFHLRELEPDYAEGWIASARLAMREGEWPFALDALGKALELEPRRFDAYAFLGRTLEQANEFPAALEAYESALEIFPLMPSARQGKARIEQQQAGRAL